MRILMPVDASSFSKAAVAFVTSRSTLLEEPTTWNWSTSSTTSHCAFPVP